MGVFSILILLGSIQGVILSIFFLFRNKTLPTRILGLVLITISLALFLTYLQLQINLREYPFLIKAILPLPLFFIPLLYIYLLLITGSINKVSKQQLIYFIPLAIILVYNIPFYFGSVSLKVEYYERVELLGNPLFFDKVEDLFVNSIVFIFSVLTFKEARVYKKRVMNAFSDLHKARTKWIQFLAFVMLFLSSVALGLLIFQINFPDEYLLFLNFITAICSTAVVYFIGYYTLVHQEVFVAISLEINNLKEPERELPAKKEEEKTLSYQNLSDKINLIIINEKLYRNPELTLSGLADKSEIPAYLVSKIISSQMQTNFYNLVNNYRVEEVKKELLEKKGRGIMEIAYQAGFNTKSTFYEVFKKNTGFSPSEFILKNQPQ